MTMQNKQMMVVLYCTLIDYYVVSMYDTYNTIERMSTDIIARVGGDIEMWLSHFFLRVN